MLSVPPLMVVAPVNVLVPVSTQVPACALVSNVVAVLFGMAPMMVFVAVLEPCNVSVLMPFVGAVKELVRTNGPAPSISMVAPPVVPVRAMTRSLVSPGPV